jgi:hypothetical protein
VRTWVARGWRPRLSAVVLSRLSLAAVVCMAVSACAGSGSSSSSPLPTTAPSIAPNHLDRELATACRAYPYGAVAKRHPGPVWFAQEAASDRRFLTAMRSLPAPTPETSAAWTVARRHMVEYLTLEIATFDAASKRRQVAPRQLRAEQQLGYRIYVYDLRRFPAAIKDCYDVFNGII